MSAFIIPNWLVVVCWRTWLLLSLSSVGYTFLSDMSFITVLSCWKMEFRIFFN